MNDTANRTTCGFALSCLVTTAMMIGSSPAAARAQATLERTLEKAAAPIEASPTGAVAAAGAPSIRVSKTAVVDGQYVRGEIRISNTGGQSAMVNGLADSLEVHFPRSVSPPPLPDGSTSNWFHVADVPIEFTLPASIPPGATTTIGYSFSLCLVRDFAGANSMRNVVTVTVEGPSGSVKTFITRSVSFPPPVLDCQACCLPDGSCTDSVPDDCAADGGLSRGAGTDCATGECTQACCLLDDSCDELAIDECAGQGGEPQGLGAACATTQCCVPRGESFCQTLSDCCNDGGPMTCVGNKCCGPRGQAGGCDDVTDCCGTEACVGNTCCIPRGESFCQTLSDCCNDGGPMTCVGNKCCGPRGQAGGCDDVTDCCGTEACVGNTCCIPRGESFCQTLSDCCNDGGPMTCVGNKCCGPRGQPGGCVDATDCCGAEACVGNTCCIPRGESFCQGVSDCCNDGGPMTCTGNKCCGPLGQPGGCVDPGDCCGGEACVANTCCIARGESFCQTVSDCCNDGGPMTCAGNRCCGPLGEPGGCVDAGDCCGGETCVGNTCCITAGNSGCSDSADCCGSSVCEAGSCCFAQFRSGCSADSDCCSGLVCSSSGTCEGVFEP